MINHMVEYHRSSLDGVFHALADSTRRSMIRQLAGGQRTVTELSRPFDMSLAAASKHVKVLERAGLVRRAVDGRVHRCSLETGPLAEAHDWLRSYEGFWNQRLDALEGLLTSSPKRTDG
ncbi:ArsR/SmtB family transcription factor [Methylobacterium gnaphalii]|uniref:Transcriptional regulator n=1 Tax=Methylobacterium gnaphalii TaxID=1010610 RepID=A0A512JGB1_9HYPH|nr:metalloregulator ArsR/SmtB family transcription factor [Methylobacterium gnaphalii]GEP08990.1 transcriptional regulator [Methylobacterium gnaphalii]GJD67533.1 hypothetical protein MMMDOFMJ_0448 [Methylobacterium gnaphalii]GLS51412.1 transcriptional regulator [Methylobacterium gnaphalii]